MATQFTSENAEPVYHFYRVAIEPNFRVWREKNPNDEPVRSMTIRLSASNIYDAQAKVWKATNLDQEVYEIVSICTDGYYNRYSKYSDDD